MDATSPKIAATGTIATRTIAPGISADELAAAAGDNKALAKMLSALISSNNALISSNNEFQNRIETLETELDIANNELSVASVANTGPIKHASLQNLELMGVESKMADEMLALQDQLEKELLYLQDHAARGGWLVSGGFPLTWER